nr:hypothetical protein [uncultured Draconibacterium sp.]
MTKLEKVNTIPISGETEEVIFDLPESWRGQDWNFVKFTLSDGTNWYGHFRERYFRGSFAMPIYRKKELHVLFQVDTPLSLTFLKKKN